ncbi:hypothetical protein GcM1_216011b [Golovinomyces cichoracearum]|uniref:Uncharacterized protein n=1 Tax=Golovinomyces cichoracearum TaxID=62708 RepID=A0A420IT95_9PEZI|nr:hypothetical protein GcM1_216011b [Golovinomyces cichoracearum]
MAKEITKAHSPAKFWKILQDNPVIKHDLSIPCNSHGSEGAWSGSLKEAKYHQNISFLSRLSKHAGSLLLELAWVIGLSPRMHAESRQDCGSNFNLGTRLGTKWRQGFSINKNEIALQAYASLSDEK